MNDAMKQIHEYVIGKDAEQEAWSKGQGYREVVTPVHDQILIRKLPDLNKSAGGIILSKADATTTVTQGQVISVGPGKRIEGSKEVAPVCTRAGDLVTFGQFAGTNTVKINGEVHLILTDGEITGILHREEV